MASWGTTQDRTDSAQTSAPEEGAVREGSTLGRYAVIHRIGAGGMGSVWEGQHIDLQKRVAIKVLHPELAKNQEVHRRFLQEGQAAGRIRHPNAVDVSDVGQQGGIAYLVMEYLDGEALSQRLQRDGALPLSTIAELMVPVLAAVSSAHRKGIVHRDLKPDNVFLAQGEDGTLTPKILDFGISKLAQEDGQGALTAAEALLGTPRYMSPEQVKNSKAADARSDQYSIGVILYECATGRCPIEGTSLFSIFQSVVLGSFQPLQEVRPDLPPRFVHMVWRSMHLDPAQRFASLDELANELLTFASPLMRASWAPKLGGAQPEPEPPPPPEAHAPTTSRRAAWPIAAAVTMLAVAAIVALALRRPPGQAVSPAAPPPPVTLVAAPSPPAPVAPTAPIAPPAPIVVPVPAAPPPAALLAPPAVPDEPPRSSGRVRRRRPEREPENERVPAE